MPLTALAAGFAIAAVQTQHGKAPAGPSESEANVELILLDVLYEHLRLDSALSALQDSKGRRYLPLRALGKALGFRIKVSPARHAASGFLNNPDDAITFQGYAGTWTRRGRSTRFDPSLCFERDNELYVESELLSHVAGIHFEWRLTRLELDVSADSPLPVRKQWMQQSLLDHSKPVGASPNLPVVLTPFSLWTPPSLDVHWYSDAVLENTAREATSRLQVEGQGDLLFMSGRYRFISASADRPAAFLLSAGRQDPGGMLLGPLHATQFSIGDINLPQLPLFARARSGLGVTFSNIPLPGTQSSNLTQVEGRAQSGSIVELYRGSELLATGRADSLGHYAFSSFALDSGPNELRIIAMAPDGEVQEEQRTLYGDTTGPPSGKGQFRVTAVKVGDSIVPGSAAGISDEQKRLELIGEYRWGLASNSWLAMTAADSTGPFGESQTLGLGFHSWNGGSLWRLETMASDKGGFGASIGLSRRFGTAFLSFDQTFASPRFGSQVLPEIGSDASSISRLRLDGSFGSKRRPLSYAVGIDRYNGSSPATLVRARLAGGDGQTYVANTVYAKVGSGPIDATGLLQLRRQFGQDLGRLDVGYGFGAELPLQNVRLSLDRRIASDYRVRLGLDYDASRLGKFESVGTLYRLFGPFELGLNLAVDVRGVLKANLLLSVGMQTDEAFHGMALARPGASETGSVAVRIYLDRNYDGKLDQGDVLLPNIGVRVGGRAAIARSGHDGICYVDRLASNQEAAITLNEDNFEDPSWTSSTPGALVLPRSGRVTHLDLGVIEAAEIDGRVQGLDRQGLSALLVDYLGKVCYTSVLDDAGTYAFSHVKPGDYTLRLVDLAGQSFGERLVRVAPAATMKDCDIQLALPKSAHIGG